MSTNQSQGPFVNGRPIYDKRHYKVKGHKQRMKESEWNQIPFKQRFLICNGKMSMMKAKKIGNGLVEVSKGFTEK